MFYAPGFDNQISDGIKDVMQFKNRVHLDRYSNQAITSTDRDFMPPSG